MLRRLDDLPPLKFSNRAGQGLVFDRRILAELRVLSAVDRVDRRMLASDGGSAEVVHALVKSTGISGDGLIRAMRPGGDAPLKPGQDRKVLIMRSPCSNGTRYWSSTWRGE